MLLRGRVHKYGDDCDTDRIIPAKMCYTDDPGVLGAHCFEYEDPGFAARVRPGDLIFAGQNFGCGSSREHAPIAISGAGIAGVVAKGFARIFFRNALNIGLPVLVCPDAVDAVESGSEVTLDLDAGTVTAGGRTFRGEPLPPFMQNLVRSGGLMPYVVERLREKGMA